MRIVVMVLDGVFDTGLAAVSDTLALANGLATGLVDGTRPPFEVSRVGVRRRVTTGQGLTVPVDEVPRRAPDLVVVPALAAKSGADLELALDRPDVADARALLQDWSARRTVVAGACTSTFILASAGLLDGRAATTTWWLAAPFAQRFPRVKLDASRMVVEDDKVITAGAALAHLDLALSIVRRKSPTLARTTGCHLAFQGAASQSAFSFAHHHAHSDELVERFETWAKQNVSDFSLGRAARAVGASQRTLERRVHAVLGKSPLTFVQDLRVAEAVHELETTDRGIEEIAESVGYQSGATLRAVLRKRTGLGLRELRVRAG